jgi:hypothetical protein
MNPEVPHQLLNLSEQTLKIFHSIPVYRTGSSPNVTFYLSLHEATQWKALDNQIRYQAALERWQGGLPKNRGKKK